MKWLPLFLAQFATPHSAEFFSVLGSLLFIGMIISLYYNIMANRRRVTETLDSKRWISPDPLNIKSVHDLVTQPQFQKLEQEMDRRFDNVDKNTAHLGRDLNSRINDVLKELSVLRGAFDQSQRRLHKNDD
jgi:hypothetical protein